MRRPADMPACENRAWRTRSHCAASSTALYVVANAFFHTESCGILPTTSLSLERCASMSLGLGEPVESAVRRSRREPCRLGEEPNRLQPRVDAVGLVNDHQLVGVRVAG